MCAEWGVQPAVGFGLGLFAKAVATVFTYPTQATEPLQTVLWLTAQRTGVAVCDTGGAQ